MIDAPALALWEQVCRVFLWRDETRFHAAALGDAAQLPPERDATQVLEVLESIKASGGGGQVGASGGGGQVGAGAGALLASLGFRRDEAGRWAADAETVAWLIRAQDAHRREFHRRVAELRYEAFREELVMRCDEAAAALAAAGVAAGATAQLESGGGGVAGYAETPAMASAQRDALSAFCARFEAADEVRPVLNGLHRALQRQLQEEHAVVWTLEDAALVERGHEFAYGAVRLVVHDLRFRPLELDVRVCPRPLLQGCVSRAGTKESNSHP